MTRTNNDKHPLQMLTLRQVTQEFGFSVSDLIELIENRELDCYLLGDDGERIRFIRRDLYLCISALRAEGHRANHEKVSV